MRRFLAGNRARIEEARALAADDGESEEARFAAAALLVTFEDAQRLLGPARKRRRDRQG